MKKKRPPIIASQVGSSVPIEIEKRKSHQIDQVRSDGRNICEDRCHMEVIEAKEAKEVRGKKDNTEI